MFPTTQNSITDLSSALAHSKVVETQSGAGKAFIQFKFETGSFEYGRDKLDITGDRIVVNTMSFTHGWVLWVDGKNDKVVRSFIEDLPAPMPGREDKDGDFCSPAEARGFEARFEDDNEALLVFETSSYGGRKGVDDLLNKVRARSGQGEKQFLFPVVELTADEPYKGKKGKMIYNPLFKVVAWMDQDGNLEGEAARSIEAPAEEEAEKPVRRRRSA